MPYNYKQGQIVNLITPIKLPDGSNLFHPVLIINSNRAISYEGYYIGVMMSATAHRDRYTFICDPNMFETPLKECSNFRTYILVSFFESDVKELKSTMKPLHFGRLLNEIRMNVFNQD